jgi:hypothetical protein
MMFMLPKRKGEKENEEEGTERVRSDWKGRARGKEGSEERRKRIERICVMEEGEIGREWVEEERRKEGKGTKNRRSRGETGNLRERQGGRGRETREEKEMIAASYIDYC